MSVLGFPGLLRQEFGKLLEELQDFAVHGFPVYFEVMLKEDLEAVILGSDFGDLVFRPDVGQDRLYVFVRWKELAVYLCF